MMRFMVRNRILTAYVPDVLVKMRTGGVSNRSIVNIVRQNLEILRAARHHRISMKLLPFLFYKVLSRLRQYVIASIE